MGLLLANISDRINRELRTDVHAPKSLWRHDSVAVDERLDPSDNSDNFDRSDRSIRIPVSFANAVSSVSNCDISGIEFNRSGFDSNDD